MIYRLLFALALAVGVSSAARAQTQQVLTGCGTASPPAGRAAPSYANSGGSGCVDTTVQAVAAYRGGTIAAGGTSQQLMAANPNRRGFSVQNQSTGDLYIKVGQTATLTNLSLRIAAGGLYESPPQHVSPSVINIIGATTAQAFYATEY